MKVRTRSTITEVRDNQPALSPDLRAPASELGQRIAEADHIYIGTHKDPDGDAIGSLLGLTWALREAGMQVTAACADPVPSIYRFLPGSDGVTHEPPTDEDLIISLDAGDLDRLGDLHVVDRFVGRPLVNVDHHVTNRHFGDVVLVDPKAAATGEIVYLLLGWLELPLSLRTATCLLTGIVTDTRSFRTSNTTPRVLQVAALLMEAGAPLPEIAQQVFERKSVASLCLLDRVLHVMQKTDRIIWSQLTLSMLRECDASPEDTDGIINLLNSTREADMAILFREQDDGNVDVGFRSKPGIDVASIAVALGGGGHPQASGCQLNGPLPDAREHVLNVVRAMRDGEVNG